jgi:DNA-binding NtrC family response regulator
VASKNLREILLVGSDLSANLGLHKELRARACEISTASIGEEALVRANTRQVDVIVSELVTPGLSGLELLRQLHPAKPNLPIILIDKQANVGSAIEATKLGVYEYMVTPIQMLELVSHIVRAASHPHEVLPAFVADQSNNQRTGLIGSSSVMMGLQAQISLAAGSSLTILIRGATGTGKELVARAIHEHSSRADQPFIAFNCSAIPEPLFESELFGHEAGAYTGARARRIGWFERAHRGTLFLDEVGDLTLAAQVKLLRVLQEQRLQRLGGSQDIHLDVRVLAATHRDLESMRAAEKFREDLYYRLNGFTIKTPELALHPEDIPELASHFLRKWQMDASLPPVSISREAIEFLKRQRWEGNVRELENAIQRAALLAQGQAIELIHAQQACGSGTPVPGRGRKYRPEPLTDLVERTRAGEITNLRALAHEQVDRSLVERLMELSNGSQSSVAKLMGVTRTTLRQILRKLGIL